MEFVKDYSSKEFGPDCMCELCMRYGWHDYAPFFAKCVVFLKRLWSERRSKQLHD